MVRGSSASNVSGAVPKTDEASSVPSAASKAMTMSISKSRRETIAQTVLSLATSGHRRTRNSGTRWRFTRTALTALEAVSSLIIVLNAAAIGLSSDVEPGWPGWGRIDTAFAAAFTLEMLFKVALQRGDYLFGRDRWWNIFEAALVALSIAEVVAAASVDNDHAGGWGLLRMLRLVRITRLLRVCRLQVFTELLIMVQGALGGVRTLCWATVLMFFPLYGAAIVFRETLGSYAHEGNGAECFATLPMSLYTLFRCVVSSECADDKGRPIFLLVTAFHGWGYSLAYCLLELVMCFGLFNVVVGIFIENVLAGAKHNDLLAQRERLRNQSFFAEKMAELAKHLYESSCSIAGEDPTLPPLAELMDRCSKMTFTAEVVEEAFSRPQVRELFVDLSIAEEDSRNIYGLLDLYGDGAVDMAQLFDGIAHLRGSPCKSDLVSLNFVVEHMAEVLSSQVVMTQAMYVMLQQAAVPTAPAAAAGATTREPEEATGLVKVEDMLGADAESFRV